MSYFDVKALKKPVSPALLTRMLTIGEISIDKWHIYGYYIAIRHHRG